MRNLDVQTAAARWVDDHGECLYRYALVRVRKPEVAEDLVQETFLAAVRGYKKFGARSSERSWLVGILKNKIVDRLRTLLNASRVSAIASRGSSVKRLAKL